MHIEPLRDETGTITHFVAIERDVTLDMRRFDELEFVADRDILTGIPNRQAFLRTLEAEIKTSNQNSDDSAARPPLCLAWIDVDGFKNTNNAFGHEAGDSVLFDIAKRLAENMRRIDTVGRQPRSTQIPLELSRRGHGCEVHPGHPGAGGRP